MTFPLKYEPAERTCESLLVPEVPVPIMINTWFLLKGWLMFHNTEICSKNGSSCVGWLNFLQELNQFPVRN